MAATGSWKGTVLAVLAGGVAGVFLAPIIGPAIARSARPAAKAMIKAGVALYQRGQETVAELREAVEDATAEFNSEQASARAAQASQQAAGNGAETSARTAMH